MSKEYKNNKHEEEQCKVTCDPYIEVAKDERVKPSYNTLLALIVSAILIVIGILSTLAIFLGWQTFMTYLVAGIGFVGMFGGLLFLGCALIGRWE